MSWPGYFARACLPEEEDLREKFYHSRWGGVRIPIPSDQQTLSHHDDDNDDDVDDDYGDDDDWLIMILLDNSDDDTGKTGMPTSVVIGLFLLVRFC